MSYETDFDRVGAMFKQSGGLPPHPLRVEINKRQSMANSYSRPAPRGRSKIQIPNINIGLLINLAIPVAIGLVGYNLYKKFFGGDAQTSMINDKNDKGSAALGSTYVSSSQATADTLTNTAASLATKGLTVSAMHKSIANTFQTWLNSLWVDHDRIVATILKEDIQTFRLVSVAYGTRSLPTYAASPAHIATVGIWSQISSLWDDNQYTGTLKQHLNGILTDSEKTKISKYLAVI